MPEGHPAPSAKLTYSFLRILTGSDLSIRRLPLMVAEGPEEGPRVWVTACSHGDEVGGIVVVQELFRRLKRELLRGAVHAFPLMNPMGFETASRTVGMNREDLNRSFPGSAAGTLGERIAAAIFERIVAERPDLAVDLHNDWIRSIPYALVDPYPGSLHKTVYRYVMELAEVTGLPVVRDTQTLTRSLSHALLLHGIPALTLELGEPYVINEVHVHHGLEAITNLLVKLGMLASPPEPFRYALPEGYDGAVLAYSDRPYGSRTGIVRFLARPGEALKRGQPFARIVNAFGRHLETVRAQEDGLILGHTDSSVGYPGMAIMAFGVREAAREAPRR